jgi:hypothetical protein
MVFGCAEDEYAQVYSDPAYVYDTIARQWAKFRIGAPKAGVQPFLATVRSFLPVGTAAISTFQLRCSLDFSRESITRIHWFDYALNPQKPTLDEIDHPKTMYFGKWKS